MKDIVCTTHYHKGIRSGEQTLIIGNQVMETVKSEVEMVRVAKKHGIDFKQLEAGPAIGSFDSFYTQWKKKSDTIK